jgi:hypothetical protein
LPPAVVFVETDSQIQSYHRNDDWPSGESWEEELPSGGENWDEELLIPGRLVYVGQGQSQFVRADEPHPGMLWPKRRNKRSKKKKRSPQPPPPSSSPAPIDWDDWEELCQEAPPVPAPPPPPPPPAEQSEEEEPSPSEPEDWEDEIACYHAAYNHQPEDWEAEMALFHHQPEDWEPELSL